MSAQTLDMFAGVVKEIAAGPRVSSFQNLTADLLRRLSEKGLTLEQCTDRRLLNRSISTLEGHCREYGIRFSDYTPSNMRRHVLFTFRSDPQGDVYDYTGPEAATIADILGVGVGLKPGVTGTCFFSAHYYEAAKEKLRAHGYWAKIAKPKKAKVVANG